MIVFTDLSSSIPVVTCNMHIHGIEYIKEYANFLHWHTQSLKWDAGNAVAIVLIIWFELFRACNIYVYSQACERPQKCSFCICHTAVRSSFVSASYKLLPQPYVPSKLKNHRTPWRSSPSLPSLSFSFCLLLPPSVASGCLTNSIRVAAPACNLWFVPSCNRRSEMIPRWEPPSFASSFTTVS